MNAPATQSTNVPAERPRPQVHAGAPVAALVPQTLDEAFRLATAIAQSGLAPQGIQRADQIMVAIMAGAELGLAPFQALQSFAVINGRPTLWGDGLVAVARAQGVKVKEWMEGEGDGAIAWCEATRPDTEETIKRSFSVADAKRANLWGKRGPWTEYPKRMLGMRARAWALRDGCADMLRGFQVREEVEDIEVREVSTAGRQTTGMRARIEAREADVADQQGFDARHVAAETGATHTVDEILEGDFIPTHEQDPAPPSGEANGAGEGAATQDAGSASPPPQTTEAAQSELTLAERCAAFERRITDATATVKLKAIWGASAGLRNDIDKADPDTIGGRTVESITAFWQARFDTVEQEEKEARG